MQKRPLPVLRALAVLLVAPWLSGCPMPPTPREKASEAAEELNQSARWGRMDVATRGITPDARESFLVRHKGWHNDVRIVDTEIAGLAMTDSNSATVHVDVSWLLSDDPTLRLTRVEQKWSDAKGGWLLQSEKRVGGSTGLFGEKIDHAEKKKDTHFPTRTIR